MCRACEDKRRAEYAERLAQEERVARRVAEIASLADGTPSTQRAIANATWRERNQADGSAT